MLLVVLLTACIHYNSTGNISMAMLVADKDAFLDQRVKIWGWDMTDAREHM